MEITIRELEYLGTVCGDTLGEILDGCWEDIIAAVSFEAGSQTRIVPQNVRIEYSEKLCVVVLSIIYASSEYNFCLDGITESDLQKEFVYTGYKKNNYKKYSVGKLLNVDSATGVLGILGGAVDWICYNYTDVKDTPYLCIQKQYPELMKNRFGVFHSQLMLRFLRDTPTRKRGLEGTYRLIEATSERLIPVEKIPGKMEGDDRVYYYRTIDALNQKAFRSALYYYRRKSGLTQAELAKQIEVCDRQMQRYETEDFALANAPLETLEKIACILGVKTEDLVLDGKLVRKL